MVLMAVLCGTSLVPLWSHNFSMPALLGGDILKPMKGTGCNLSYPRLFYGCLPRSFCTLDELREDATVLLIRYNPNHVLHRLLPQPKILITIYANALAILYFTDVRQCFYEAKLSIEWFSETFIDFTQPLRLLIVACVLVMLSKDLLTYLLTKLQSRSGPNACRHSVI